MVARPGPRQAVAPRNYWKMKYYNNKDMKVHNTWEYTVTRNRPRGREEHRKYDNTKIGIKRGNSYRENEEVSGWKAQIHTPKPNWHVSTLTEVFFNQKLITICENTVKMASRVWWRKIILFWLIKTSVNVETYQLRHRVRICAFYQETSSCFR